MKKQGKILVGGLLAIVSSCFSIRSIAAIISSWLSRDSGLPLCRKYFVSTISSRTSRNSDCQFWNVHSPK